MKNDILHPFIERNGIVILDGALATELERRGADLNDPLWSAKILVEKPDLIRQVHYDYFVAGADVAITATYQASFEGFARRGLSEDEAAALMRLSVRLACEARDQFWSNTTIRKGRLRPLVAASIGSYGAYLADGSEYLGDYGLTVGELKDFHRQRLAVLTDTEADLLACETIPCQLEGEALVDLLAEFPQAIAWLSFSCCDDNHVCHGEPFASCVEMAQSDQVVAVGVNCTPPRFVPALLRHASTATRKPLLAYPNSGERWDAQEKCWVPDSGVEGFGELAVTWHGAGARLVGGCCRTTPEDIAGIVHALQSRHLPRSAEH